MTAHGMYVHETKCQLIIIIVNQFIDCDPISHVLYKLDQNSFIIVTRYNNICGHYKI